MKDQRGIAALMTIVIVSAATLIMAYTASFLGLGELDLGYTFSRDGEVFSFTDGCVNEAIYRVISDSSYSGSSLSVSEGSCIINVTGTGNDRTIIVTGTVGNYYKKIQTEITLSGGNAIINSWQELDN